MQPPEHFSIEQGIACYRPQGEVSLTEGVEFISDAIAYCREQGRSLLLINVLGLHGHAVPTLVDRYWMAQDWAQAADGDVIVCVVARAEHIDPQKYGVMVATDAGLTCNVYTDEARAFAWLDRIAHRANAPESRTQP